MDVTIVCHTEFGRVVGRHVAYTKDVCGVERGVPNLIRLADKYGARVTFAVMPEAAEHFPRGTEHEIGLHVHPGWKEEVRDGVRWYIGDSYLRSRCSQSVNAVGLMSYPYEEQLAMIRAGKDRLTDVLGVKPTSFVSGIWSVNNDTVKALVSQGFRHDCSPIIRCRTGVYDWSRLGRICLPYHPAADDYQRKGTLPILIVPSSQTLLGENVNPEAAPVLGLSWLKACFAEYYSQNVPLFNVCLHSPCMTDPYFEAAMDRLLEFVARHRVNFRFVSEIGDYGKMHAAPNLLPYLWGVNPQLVRTALASTVLQRRAAHGV